jgi:hypothetical protein
LWDGLKLTALWENFSAQDRWAEQLREKIRDSLLHAMQKGTDFKATLPPVAQDYITIESAQFKDSGSGDLNVDLQSRFQISDEPIQELPAR